MVAVLEKADGACLFQRASRVCALACSIVRRVHRDALFVDHCRVRAVSASVRSGDFASPDGGTCEA
jgi:hypothetical protein